MDKRGRYKKHTWSSTFFVQSHNYTSQTLLYVETPNQLTSMNLNTSSLVVWFDPSCSSSTWDQSLGSPRPVWLCPLEDEDWRAGGLWVRKVSFYRAGVHGMSAWTMTKTGRFVYKIAWTKRVLEQMYVYTDDVNLVCHDVMQQHGEGHSGHMK